MDLSFRRRLVTRQHLQFGYNPFRLRGGVRLRAGLRQGYQALDHRLVAARAFVILRLNRPQNGAQAIQQIEQHADDLGVSNQFAVAQQAEQVFAGM